MIEAASIINFKSLGLTVLYSLLAGVGIAVIFGAGVSSAAGLLDALRERRTAASTAWGALALVCLLSATAAVVLGIVAIAAKH